MTDAVEKTRALEIRQIVADDRRFSCLHQLVSMLTPVYKLLRMVDSFTPAVGKVYYKAMKIDNDMKAIADEEGEDSWQAHLYRSWVSDWGYFHCDIHSLGYCLDPEYHHLMDDMPAEVWTEFVRCGTRMLKAAPIEAGYTVANLCIEYSEYQNLTGSFSAEVLALAKNQPAHLWWQQWGKSTPSLRFVATRALAQCVSASCSEQAWSEYDLVHCRRRNRLDKVCASNLTRGHNQARLIRRLRQVRYTQEFIDWTDSDDESGEAFFSD